VQFGEGNGDGVGFRNSNLDGSLRLDVDGEVEIEGVELLENERSAGVAKFDVDLS
jgi:hypothetical protein